MARVNVLQNLVPTTDGALLAAFGVLFGWMTDISNVVLLIALGGFFLLDLLTGMAKCYMHNPHDWFDGQVLLNGIIKKMLMFMLVLMAGLMDGLGTMIPTLGETTTALSPVTKSVLSLLIVGQLGSILKNMRRAGVSTPALDFLARRIGGEDTKEVPAQKRDSER